MQRGEARHASHDYAFRGRRKLGGAKWPWAVSITAIRANEVVRRGTRQTPCIFNLRRGAVLSLSTPIYTRYIYFAFGGSEESVFLLVAIEPGQARRKATEKMGAAKESIDLKRLWRRGEERRESAELGCVVGEMEIKRKALFALLRRGGHCSTGFFSTPAY